MEGEKKGKYSYLIKNTGILAISSFSSRILVFLLVPLYTSVLSTEEYGAYDISVTTIQLLMPIFTANIYDAVMRFFMDEKYSKRAVSAVGIKHIGISVILFSVIVLFNMRLSVLDDIVEYSGLILLYYISNLVNLYLTQMAKGLEKVKSIAIAGILNTAATLILNIVLLIFVHAGLSGFFVAYIVGQSVSAIYIFADTKYWQLMSLKTDKIYEREMLAYSVPLILGTLGWWCNNVSDRYIVTFLCGLAANGVYSVAYKIPAILTTFQQIFLQAWQISAVKEYDDDDSAQFYGKTFVVVNVGMCYVCMILILLTKPIAHFLYAKDFYEAWQYVPFLLVSGVFNAAAGVIGPILNANMNSKSLGQSSLFGAAINVMLNFALISIIGVQGAAISTAVSSYMIYVFRKKAVADKIVIESYWKVYASWLCITIQSVACIYLNSLVIEFIIIILVTCIYGRDIVELMKLVTKKFIHR